MASAGLYASLHLIPDNHANIPPLVFLQAGCPSCRPTNSVKALKDSFVNILTLTIILTSTLPTLTISLVSPPGDGCRLLHTDASSLRAGFFHALVKVNLMVNFGNSQS